jgi:hypothetical protein
MPSLMHRPYPYLALSLAVTACGEDGRPDDSASATVASMATSLGTEPTTSDTGDSQTGTPTTTQNSGMSATMTGTDSTPDTGTSTDPTATATDTGATQGTSATGTTGAVCEPDQLCGFDCCGADELCDNGECVPDCGGPPPCGVAKECCAEGDLCYLGECVTPGAACDEQVCATKPDLNSCGEGFLCDPSLKLCLPTKADLGCQYIPPLNLFKPVPLFTWGKRKVIACAKDLDCQTAELCTNKVCTPTWKHWVPAGDDMPTHYQSSSIPWSSTSTTTACPRSSSTRTPARAPRERRDPGDPRRHRREAVDRHRPGLPHRQHLEPGRRRHRRRRQAGGRRRSATASTWWRSRATAPRCGSPTCSPARPAARWRSPTSTTRARRRSSTAPPSTTTSARSCTRAPPASASTARARSPASPTSTATGAPS